MQTIKLELELSYDEAAAVVETVTRLRKSAALAKTDPRMTAEECNVAYDNKIAAIKMVRNRLGCTLVDAKNIVEKG